MNRGIDFALSIFNYESTPVEKIKEQFFCEPRLLETQNTSSEYILIDEQKTNCFKVNRIKIEDSYVKEAASFYIGIVTKGFGEIEVNGQTFPVNEGSKFFVPCQTGAVKFESDLGMEIIATFPPE